MKDNPYINNIKKELKDYKDLCRNKSGRTYSTYSDWKEHIIELLKPFDVKLLENFKHYCIYREKTENRSQVVFLPVSISFISFYMSHLDWPEQWFWMELITYTTAAMVAAAVIAWSYSSYTLLKDFYEDVAIIIQEYIESIPSDDKRRLIESKEDEVRK